MKATVVLSGWRPVAKKSIACHTMTSDARIAAIVASFLRAELPVRNGTPEFMANADG